MIELPDMPPAVAALPRDERGYPVPWFVAWIDGKPEFRVADGRKFAIAVKQKRCWVCGETLDPKQHVFLIGPMCAVNKTTSEPPVHEACAIFSVKACPFLSMPKAKRREATMPEGADCAGIPISRNPGVSLLWYCKGFTLFDDGRGGVLFRLPNPAKVRWWAEGREATRGEILESINTGVPILQRVAESQSPDAVQELSRCVRDAMKLVPAEKMPLTDAQRLQMIG